MSPKRRDTGGEFSGFACAGHSGGRHGARAAAKQARQLPTRVNKRPTPNSPPVSEGLRNKMGLAVFEPMG